MSTRYILMVFLLAMVELAFSTTVVPCDDTSANSLHSGLFELAAHKKLQDLTAALMSTAETRECPAR